MRLRWWVLIQYSCVLIKRDNTDTGTEVHRGETMWRHRENAWGHQKLTEAWNRFSFTALGKNQWSWHSDFWLISSRTEKQYISVVEAIWLGVLCFSSSRRLIQWQIDLSRELKGEWWLFQQRVLGWQDIYKLSCLPHTINKIIQMDNEPKH